MDRAKLLELRKKKAQVKADNQRALLEANAQVKDAIIKLHELINGQEKYDDSKLIEQISSLRDSLTFKDEIKRLETALNASNSETNGKFDKLIEAVNQQNADEVVLAIETLITRLEDNKVSQDAKDYQPIRRVRKLGNQFIYDDEPWQAVAIGGGGVSGGSSVQPDLIRTTGDGAAIAVVNPDGTNISGGGGGGGDVTVDNFPDDYPLPSDQITTLTPQTDALTDSQLRAAPVEVSAIALPLPTGASTEDKQDDIITAIGNITSTPDKPTNAYAISNIDPNDVTYKYFGFEDKDGAWYIMRKTLATNVFLYAKGPSSYATAWTGRAGQSYDSYSNTF